MPSNRRTPGLAATTLKNRRAATVNGADNASAEWGNWKKSQEGDQKAEANERPNAGTGSYWGVESGAKGAVVGVGIFVVGAYGREAINAGCRRRCVVMMVLEHVKELSASSAKGQEGQQEQARYQATHRRLVCASHLQMSTFFSSITRFPPLAGSVFPFSAVIADLHKAVENQHAASRAGVGVLPPLGNEGRESVDDTNDK